MLNKNRLTRKSFGEEDVNPMDGLSNLADVMLVLAVGIMLALVINWNLDISHSSTSDSSASKDNAVEFQDDDMEKVDNDDTPGDGEDMKKLGAVYYDEKSGKYYIIESDE